MSSSHSRVRAELRKAGRLFVRVANEGMTGEEERTVQDFKERASRNELTPGEARAAVAFVAAADLLTGGGLVELPLSQSGDGKDAPSSEERTQ